MKENFNQMEELEEISINQRNALKRGSLEISSPNEGNRFNKNLNTNPNFNEENNLIIIEKYEEEDFSRENIQIRNQSRIPSKKESSYLRSNKKESNENLDKRALAEIYTLIRLKFNSPGNDLDVNMNLLMSIPYKVIKINFFYNFKRKLTNN